MSPFRARKSALIRNVVPIVLACFTLAVTGSAEAPKGSAAAATGGLSITTDPDSAAVYVDGRLAGQTPANLASLTAGEHRVRIVKSGYLENSRIVTVQAGPPTRLNVKLTKSSGASNEAAGQVIQSAPGGGGGGGSKKILLITLATVGGIVTTVALLPHNKAPIPGTILVSPTATGMAGQTSFRISSTGASDPDKDPLTFTWSFGDGGSGSGESVTHTYAAAGTFAVSLKVSDGKLDAAPPNASVVVGPNLTGNWTGGSLLMPGTTGALTITCGLSLTVTQTGTALTGSIPFAGNCTGSAGASASGSTAAALTHPASVTFTGTSFNFTVGNVVFPGLVISFSGTTNTAGNTLPGNVTLSQASSGFTTTSSTSFNK